MLHAADPDTERARWRVASIVLGVALAVLVIYLWIGTNGSPEHAPAASASSSASALGTADRADPGVAAKQHGADPRAGQAPVIDAITVEKKEVCEGEENLITVKAHDPGGGDAGLRVLVNGEPGWSVPLRARENTEDPNAPPRSVLVINDRGVSTQAPIPAYKINTCTPAVQLRLRPFLLANSSGEYRLETRLVSVVPPGRPRPAKFAMDDFSPTHYEWDFGDGQTATTSDSYVTHDYQFRDQSSHFSYYLVVVKASDIRGRTITARHALEILNPAYEELAAKGVVKIMTQQAPRFPVLAKDGKVTQVVRLWHFDKQNVTVDQIVAYYYGREGKEMGAAPVPPAALLGTYRIPTQAGLRIQVVLDTVKNPEIGFITYDIRGTSSDGKRAMGTFSIMRPPDAPTREKNIPVTDPMLAAKILKARELLGKELVTDEDIWALERQGKLAGLQPVPVKPQPDGPPSWLPRPPRSDQEPWSASDDPGPSEPPDPNYVPEPKSR